MKKMLLVIGLVIVCCQMGCFTKTTPIPGEKEILAEVARVVPEAYEHTKTEKTETSTICYFECKERDLSFTARGYVVKNVPVIPMPQSMAGSSPHISVSYWQQIMDRYFPEIRALFQNTDMVKRTSDAMGHNTIEVVLKSEEDLEQFVDLVMQGEEILKQEQKYVDASVLAEKSIIYYTVWIPYKQMYADGKTQNKERWCLQFVSNSTLQREEVKMQIEEAIVEVNRDLLENEHVVLYDTD